MSWKTSLGCSSLWYQMNPAILTKPLGKYIRTRLTKIAGLIQSIRNVL